MTRRIAPATVGDGGDGLARAWMLIFEHAEIERRYQRPVGLERVLAEHRAAVAAVPISEAKDTSGSTIAAPAGCAQAAEGHAPLRVPITRPACTGCSNLDATKFSGSPDLLFISNDVA